MIQPSQPILVKHIKFKIPKAQGKAFKKWVNRDYLIPFHRSDKDVDAKMKSDEIPTKGEKEQTKSVKRLRVKYLLSQSSKNARERYREVKKLKRWHTVNSSPGNEAKLRILTLMIWKICKIIVLNRQTKFWTKFSFQCDQFASFLENIDF